MTRIRRVGVDLDGTVANWLGGAVPLFQKAYGLEPDMELAEQVYSIEEVFGLTKETRPPQMKKHLYDDLHLFRHLPMLEEDSYKLTHQIKDLGAKVYIITARPGRKIVTNDTMAWLESNNFVFDDIFFTDEKSVLCKAMGIDVMLEDETKHVVKLIENGINVVVPRRVCNSDLAKKVSESIPPRTRGRSGKWVYAENRKEAFYAVKEYLS